MIVQFSVEKKMVFIINRLRYTVKRCNLLVTGCYNINGKTKKFTPNFGRKISWKKATR